MNNFTFDPIEHVYTLDGKPLHGVTTVLKVIAKPALIQWSADEAVKYIESNFPTVDEITKGFSFSTLFKEARVAHRKKKEKAGENGTNVHAIIEDIVKDAITNNHGIVELDTHENPQVHGFLQWAKKVKFLASEVRLYSKEYWYAGTADLVVEIDSKRYVGDIKTSKGIYPEYFIQCSAYAHSFSEMGLYDSFDGVVIVRPTNDGSFEEQYNFDLEGNFECFKACLTIKNQLEAINSK